jgi:hypothetical protein
LVDLAGVEEKKLRREMMSSGTRAPTRMISSVAAKEFRVNSQGPTTVGSKIFVTEEWSRSLFRRDN